jgi:Fe-S-cluster containining protein
MKNSKLILPAFSGEIGYNCKNCNAFCCNYGNLVMDKNTVLKALKHTPIAYLYTKKVGNTFDMDMGGCNCWFLEKGRCNLQECKPISCTLFPNRVVKGPLDYYIILQTLCPSSSWKDKKNDRTLLFNEIIEDFPSLIQDYGISFLEHSYYQGKAISWSQRVILEKKQIPNINDDLTSILNLSSSDTFFVLYNWSQLRITPNFLEQDMAIIDDLFYFYIKQFIKIHSCCKNIFKCIQHASKITTDELYLKYKYFNIDKIYLDKNWKDKAEYYFIIAITPYISDGWQLLDQLREQAKISLAEAVILLKYLQKCPEVKWKPMAYDELR